MQNMEMPGSELLGILLILSYEFQYLSRVSEWGELNTLNCNFLLALNLFIHSPFNNAFYVIKLCHFICLDVSMYSIEHDL